MRGIPVKAWLLTVGSALLQLLPFPFAGPLPAWRVPFAWVCLVPLLVCFYLRRKDGKPLNLWQLALLGWLNGTLWWAIHCYWVYLTFHLYGGATPVVGVLIQVLLAGMLGVNIAVFAALLGAVHWLFARWNAKAAFCTTPLAAALLWVAVELFRARILGVPWDQLGAGQVDNALLMQLPPWTGVYGVSFLLVLGNALLAQGLAVANWKLSWKFTVGGLLAGIALAVGLYPWALYKLAAPVEDATASAVLLQENLEVGAARPEMSLDQMLEEFTQLSEMPATSVLHGIPGLPQTQPASATIAPPVVIVWPESPAPFVSTDATFRHWLTALATDSHTALIVGSVGVDAAPEVPRGYRVYNSADFVTADGVFAGRYDKIHLVPFGEYVPLRQQLFFVKSLTSQLDDMDRGTKRNLFVTSGHKFGTFICYEDAFADEVRQFAKEGADVLVTISDDGWYGDSGAPWQHLNLARLRAIENHRWLLRSTDTGITAAIDPYGRVLETAPRHVRTAIEVHYGYETGTTFYTQHGDLFAYGCVIAAGLMLLVGSVLAFTRSGRSS